MLTLSVQQPYASAICAGLKKIENRCWETSHRGWILIHSSKEGTDIGNIEDPMFPLISDIAKNYSEKEEKFVRESKYYEADFSLRRELTADELVEEDFFIAHGDGFAFGAIVGAAFLEKIVEDSTDRFAINGQKHWVISDFIDFSLPHKAVNGRLRLWDFPIDKLSDENQALLRQKMEVEK